MAVFGVAIGGGTIPRVVDSGFIGAGEKQVLVIVLEIVGNLFPVFFLQLTYLGRIRGGWILIAVRVVPAKDVVFEPAVVPMAVQDNVHSLVDSQIDNGFYRAEPITADSSVGCVAVPGTGNADG